MATWKLSGCGSSSEAGSLSKEGNWNRDQSIVGKNNRMFLSVEDFIEMLMMSWGTPAP